MTPADRIREILLAHGVDPGTVSADGTTLGEELERAFSSAVDEATIDAWLASGELWSRRLDAAVAAVKARRRKQEAVQRCRGMERDDPACDHDRLLARGLLSPMDPRETAEMDIAGPFPGDKTRPPGRLP